MFGVIAMRRQQFTTVDILKTAAALSRGGTALNDCLAKLEKA